MTIGSPPTCVVTKSPGFSSCAVRATICQVAPKTFWRSSSAMRSSVYHGPVRVCASASGAFGLYDSIIRSSSESIRLELRQTFHRFEQVFRLRQDHVFERRLVGDKSIHRGDALYRRVKVFEQFVRYARRDLGAVTPTQRVFMCDDH